MDQIVRFDTPENITVEYRLAGPGTRFIAYTVDYLLILLILLCLSIVFVFAFLLLAWLGSATAVSDLGPNTLAALGAIIVGFLFIGYFPVCEFFMNGQTPGKRLTKIRVVSDRGFSLGITAIIIRNLIRIVDTAVPFLWIVPVVNDRCQRLGDLAAGTIVVREDLPAYLAIRAQLATRDLNDVEFQFQPAHLQQLRPIDVYAVENYLARRGALAIEQRQSLALRLTRGLSLRMDLPQPVVFQSQERFLEDLITCHARREARELA